MAEYVSPTYQDGAEVDATLDLAKSALQAAHVDTDASLAAIHHTLGSGAFQAAAGDHTHGADEIVSGYIDPHRLGSGTPDDNTWLRGDGKWESTGAGGAGATNLGIGARTGNILEVTSSTGTAVTLPAATESLAGIITSASQAKLNSVDYGATALSLGTTAGTACEGNDARLSDARVPVAHSHATNRLSQNNTHEAADTDSSGTAIHHTLGTGAFQAAAGNHTHSGYETAQVPVTQAEAQDGVVTLVRSWTPQRVAQAIAAQAINTASEIASVVEASPSTKQALRRLLGVPFDPSAVAGASPTLDLDFTKQVYRRYSGEEGIKTYSLSDFSTFARASTATYINAFGQVKTAAINKPRLSYNQDTKLCEGLLVEGAGTNTATQSEDFSAAIWLKTRLTVSADAVAAPDGTTTADKLIATTDSGLHYTRQLLTYASGSTVCSSVFVKRAGMDKVSLGVALRSNGTNATMTFDMLTQVFSNLSSGVTAGAIPLAGDWWRVWMFLDVGTGASQPQAVCYLGDLTAYSGDGTAGLYVWGAQVELADNVSSYIKTTTSSASRSADSLFITGAPLSDIILSSEGKGTLYASSVPFSRVGRRPVVQFDDGSDSNYIAVSGNGTNSEFQVYSSPTVQTNVVAGALTARVAQATAAAWSVGGCFASKDGGTAVLGNPALIPSLTHLRVGGSVAGAYDGVVRRLCYWPLRLSETTLKNLSVV
jgi:hypothetical protein